MSEGFSSFFGALPPEIAEHLQAQRDHADMERKDFQNRLKAFMEHMTPEHLVTFREIMHSVLDNGRIAPYLEGQATAILQYKYEVCYSCGEKHEDELLAPLVPEDEQLELPFAGADKPAEMEMLASEVMRDVEIEEKMREYNLRLPNEGEVDALPGEKPVICIGCGSLYQSAEDRMIKPVDECDGCIQKSKWG